VDGKPVVGQDTGRVDEETLRQFKGEGAPSPDAMSWWNKIGAFLVMLWVGAFFLLILGFGYSYFWSASTIIYLLMRKRVDDAEMDEVYLEEDDAETYSGPLTAPAPAPAPASTPAPAGGGRPLTMIEPPAMRPSA